MVEADTSRRCFRITVEVCSVDSEIFQLVTFVVPHQRFLFLCHVVIVLENLMVGLKRNFLLADERNRGETVLRIFPRSFAFAAVQARRLDVWVAPAMDIKNHGEVCTYLWLNWNLNWRSRTVYENVGPLSSSTVKVHTGTVVSRSGLQVPVHTDYGIR